MVKNMKKIILFTFFVLILGISSTVTNAATLFDFDGDGRADISVFRPSDGFWHIMNSSGGFASIQWGFGTDARVLAHDEPVPGDYDGDGKTDIAVFRLNKQPLPYGTERNTWHILKSSDNEFLTKKWGISPCCFEVDSPQPADYDGDGKVDLAVIPTDDAIDPGGSPTTVRILQSAGNTGTNRIWGLEPDRRVYADYDGDGKVDLAVFRTNNFVGSAEVNAWLILQSSNGAIKVERFGLPSDRLVPADYDGDKKADIAVYRPSNGFWYILGSQSGFRAIQFGASEDKPVPADYDGDGRTDVAVFRPSSGTWYLNKTKEGFAAFAFGFGTDVPVPNVYVR